MYSLILFAHILSAVLSIGPFFVLLPLVKRMETASGDVLQSHIVTFKSATRLVKHAGHVLVTTGVLLIWQGPWGWGTSWILGTLAVMVGSVFFLARAFTPTLRKFGNEKFNHLQLVKKLHRSLWIYIFLLSLMLWFMVDKPNFW
ncbi:MULTISPECIES: hypothetical protein [Planococcus]|uniref:DUF2269 domain-containing protein n=2 Tax=Planococcus TaxID=1372 RepID=A0ABN4JYR2_9BACL|nr:MULTISPECIES: hypothetical protein [Planococcus]ALS79965.1 hypothetical protein AUO94_15655 [Planococcus kocurii]AQU78052.1 hypothetical protein AJGP001_01450 [Planococcus faecalis]KAA0957386.1 hypothetical protein FQ085_09775 [Planococcus sp. ANT_H30]MDJ0331326.1 hypothetical protein [Planococcus sp. S3-L1]OHX53671.1 hypothetical protein BB777_07880 [Planococcus faecalis]